MTFSTDESSRSPAWPGGCVPALGGGVIVPIFEVHFVDVRMGMGDLAVRMVMLDVGMMVTDVGMGVAPPAVLMRMVVRGFVSVAFGHAVGSSLAALADYGVVDAIGVRSGACRSPFPDRWSMCRRASSRRAATWESNSP